LKDKQQSATANADIVQQKSLENQQEVVTTKFETTTEATKAAPVNDNHNNNELEK